LHLNGTYGPETTIVATRSQKHSTKPRSEASSKTTLTGCASYQNGVPYLTLYHKIKVYVIRCKHKKKAARMWFRFLVSVNTVLILSVASSANGQAVAPNEGCLICGDGNVVGNPSAGIFSFPGQPDVSCGVMQNAGLNGQIPLVECSFLPPLIGVCQCAPGDFDLTPTQSPAPSSKAQFPTPGACLICGDGFVTAPEAIFSFPGQPDVSCGALQDAGLNGQIIMCPFLPPLIGVCQCAPDLTPTSAPIFVADTPSPVGGMGGGGGNMKGMGMGKMSSGRGDGPTEAPVGGMSGMGKGGSMRRTNSAHMMEGDTIRGI
jgi:hypothetical protein